MATPDNKGHGHPLPKFGEWDVKNPATSEGFTVIFQKARDDKKTTTGPGAGNARAGIPPAFRNGGGDGGYRPDFGDGNQYAPPKRKKWAFCGC
uniref:Nitrate-induced NOI protein n=1 Tax=Zea mays TaxID=4577 RepID=B6T2F7_MAIZE|nr:nitrate-induced NOI protein [Zea mays]